MQVDRDEMAALLTLQTIDLGGSTSSGRPAKERDAKEGGYACRSPGHWDGTPDALRHIAAF